MDGPEGGGVDHVLRVLHPGSVCDPARVGGGHVQVRVRISVDINLVLPLQSQLVVVDSHMAEFAGDDVNIGGASRHRYYLYNCLPPGKLSEILSDGVLLFSLVGPSQPSPTLGTDK